MGHDQHNPKPAGRRLGPRTCLRKGCGQLFQPLRWNQRYCQDADCLRAVRRWQATKRQRFHRQSPANRKRQAEAEAERRRRARAVADQQTAAPNARNAPASDSAWSRSNEIPEDFCERAGCYEPLPSHCRAPARYCSRDCRRAMRRVLDRERKWLIRRDYLVCSTRLSEHCQVGRLPADRQSTTNDMSRGALGGPVGNYRTADTDTLCSSRFEHPLRGRLAADDHSKTDPDRRSRPPPTR